MEWWCIWFGNGMARTRQDQDEYKWLLWMTCEPENVLDKWFPQQQHAILARSTNYMFRCETWHERHYGNARRAMIREILMLTTGDILIKATAASCVAMHFSIFTDEYVDQCDRWPNDTVSMNVHTGRTNNWRIAVLVVSKVYLCGPGGIMTVTKWWW